MTSRQARTSDSNGRGSTCKVKSTATPVSPLTFSKSTLNTKSSSSTFPSIKPTKSASTITRSTSVVKNSSATAGTKRAPTNSTLTASASKLESTPFYLDGHLNSIGLINPTVLESYANDFSKFPSSFKSKKSATAKLPEISISLTNTDTPDFQDSKSQGRSSNFESKVNRPVDCERPLDPLEQINQLLDRPYKEISKKSNTQVRGTRVKKFSSKSDCYGSSIDSLVHDSKDPRLYDQSSERLHGTSSNSKTKREKSTPDVEKTEKFEDNFTFVHDKEKPKTSRSSRKYKDSSRYVKNVDEFSIDDYIETYKTNGKNYKNKVDDILSDFEIPKENRREGNDKLFYNYILLDSRKCSDTKNMTWDQFLDSVFYIGKGKNNRAFDHMKSAQKSEATTNKKFNTIKEIWKDDQPVKVFRVKENIIGEEAYTREAAMIDAIGKERLTNTIRGTYYGVADTLLAKEKLEMGGTLLVECWQKLKSEDTMDVYRD